MGNSIKNKQDSEHLDTLKNCQEYSKLSTEIKDYLMKNKTPSLSLDFSDDDVFSLYQKQLEFYIYFSISFCETIKTRSLEGVMTKRDSGQIEYLISNLQNILNYMGRLCLPKLEHILWRTFDQGVNYSIFFS